MPVPQRGKAAEWNLMRHGQVIETDGENARVTGKCVFSGKAYATAWVAKGILKAGIDKWSGGAMIQNAMPFYSADDREFIISGISGEAFARFGGTR
jgi:hypothetical protein